MKRLRQSHDDALVARGGDPVRPNGYANNQDGWPAACPQEKLKPI